MRSVRVVRVVRVAHVRGPNNGNQNGGSVKQYLGSSEYFRGFTNFLRSHDQREIGYDPFLALYENDPLVLTLTIDVAMMETLLSQKMNRSMCNSAFMSCGLQILFWPLACPATRYCILPSILKSAISSSAATHLELRQESLHYRLDSHKRIGFANNVANNVPLWAGTNSVKEIECVIPLQDADLELLEPVHEGWVTCEQTMNYDKRHPLPTLLIKTKGGKILAEIDCPGNAAEFIEKFNELKTKANSKSLPERAVQAHDAMIWKLLFWRTAEEREEIRTALNKVKAFTILGGSAAAPSHANMSRSLSSDDVPAILSSIGVPERYVNLFVSQKVSRDFFLSMDDALLFELGVDSALERCRMLTWIASNTDVKMATPVDT